MADKTPKEKQRPFHKLPKYVAQTSPRMLSSNAKVLYSLLQSYSSINKSKQPNARPKCWLSHASIAKQMGGISTRSVIRYLNELKKCDLIEVERRSGTTTIYYLKDSATLITAIEEKELVEQLAQLNSDYGDY